MTTPIRPSLAQMLQPQQAAPKPAAQAASQAAGGFNNALAAQRAFFNQVTTPKVTPATYTAADIARASPSPQAAAPSVQPASMASDANQPLKRPGSYLNIVI